MRNDTNGNLILHTRKSSDTLTAFSHVFGQALTSKLVYVTSELSEFKISGYIGKEGHYQKNLQFVYVNKRLVLRTKLHKLANSMLANSVLLRNNNTANDLPISNDATVGRWLAFSPPRREKHAIYILNVKCPFHAYDICLDPKKTLIEFCDWDTILKCLETLIRNFLEKEFSNAMKPEDGDIGSAKEIIPDKEIEVNQNEKLEVVMDSFRKKARKFNHSGSTTRNMVLASRIVKGVTAKRKAKKKSQTENNDNLQRNEQPESNKMLESNITINARLCTKESHNSNMDKCDLKNPIENKIQSNVCVSFKDDISVGNKVRKNSNSSSHFSSEIPDKNRHFENSLVCKFNAWSSVEDLEVDQESYIHPIVKFKKNVNERKVLSKGQCKSAPPIVKFKEKLNRLSDIQFEVEKKTAVIPLKTLGESALRKVLNNSKMNKDILCEKNNHDHNIVIETEGITINGYNRATTNIQSQKNARQLFKRNSHFERRKDSLSANGMKDDFLYQEMNNILNLEMYSSFDISNIHAKSRTVNTGKSNCAQDCLRLGGYSHKDLGLGSQVISQITGMGQNFCTSSDFLQTVNPKETLTPKKAGISRNSIDFLKTGKHIVSRYDELQDKKMHNYYNSGKCIEDTFEGHLDCCIFDSLQFNEDNECLNLELEKSSFKFSPKALVQQEPCFEDIFGIFSNTSVLGNNDDIHEAIIPKQQTAEFSSFGKLPIQQTEFSSFGRLRESIMKDSGTRDQGLHIDRSAFVPSNLNLYNYQRKSMILSSGNEADLEPSIKSDIEIKMKKNKQKSTLKKPLSFHKLSTGVSSLKIKEKRGSSNETIKRKIRINKHTEVIGKYILSRKSDIRSKEGKKGDLQLVSEKCMHDSKKRVNEESISEINTFAIDNSCSTIVSNSESIISGNSNFNNIVNTVCESSPGLLSQDIDNKSVISNSLSGFSDCFFIKNTKKYVSNEEGVINTECKEVNDRENSALSNDDNFNSNSLSNLNTTDDEVIKLKKSKVNMNSNNNSELLSNFSEEASSLKLIKMLDNLGLSSRASGETEDVKDTIKENSKNSLSFDELPSLSVLGKIGSVDCNEICQLQDKKADDEYTSKRENQMFMNEASTPVIVPISLGSSSSQAMESELNIVLIENDITSVDNKIDKQTHKDSLENAVSNYHSKHQNISNFYSGGGCISFLDRIQDYPRTNQKPLEKDKFTFEETDNLNECIEVTSMEVSNCKNCDRNVCENGSLQYNAVMNLMSTSESDKECSRRCPEKDAVNLSNLSEGNKEVTSSLETIKLINNQTGEASLKLPNRKRRSETDVQNINNKKACNFNCVSNSIDFSEVQSCVGEEQVCELEPFASKSISSQQLNEAFDRVMTIMSSKLDQQKDCECSSRGVISDIVKKQETFANEQQINLNQLHKSKSENHIQLSGGWEQRIDSHGKRFFVHKQSGISSFTAPNKLAPPNIYSMKERFGFLPKGFSPILKDGVVKCNEETIESLTPSKCEALKNVVDNCSHVDDLATVKWKDEEKLKREGMYAFIRTHFKTNHPLAFH